MRDLVEPNLIAREAAPEGFVETGATESVLEGTGALALAQETASLRREVARLHAREQKLQSELNHRIKNTLQMLQGLVSAARREADSEDARKALTEAGRRIGAIGAAQKVLYREPDAGSFAVEDFIAAVCDSLHQSLGAETDVRWSSDAGELRNDAAAPLALILNELIANAAVHGRSADGRAAVQVSLRRNEDGFELVVEDAGPGFEFTEPKKRASGLGLARGLAAQIGGRVAVERGVGARCIVRFPAERVGVA